MNQQDLTELRNLIAAKGFLGREFLTWLWFTSETGVQPIALSGIRPKDKLQCEIWIEDRIKLQSMSAVHHENSLKGGDPSQSPEAAVALSEGKLPKELKIGIHIENYGDFITTINAKDLDPRSLHLPKLEDTENGPSTEDGLVNLRLQQLDAFFRAFDGLFLRFLQERTDPSWEQNGHREMKLWIKTRKGTTKVDSLH
jgi:hypothetical protein